MNGDIGAQAARPKIKNAGREEPRMHFTTSDGLSLHYIDEGSGMPLFCVPGLTRNAFDFEAPAEILARHHRVIRLTPRGRIPSDYDADWRNYVVPVEARDVIELMDHLGLGRAVILGTSRGGLVAMYLAATVKDRLAGVLLNDIGPEIAPDGLARIMTYVGVAPRSASFDDLAANVGAMLAPQFPGIAHADWLRHTRRWFAPGPDGPALAYDPKIRDAMTALGPGGATDMWPQFEALDGIPLALLRGANSDLLAPSTVAQMRARRPDMIYAEVPDRGHALFLDEPEALAAIEALIALVRQ